MTKSDEFKIIIDNVNNSIARIEKNFREDLHDVGQKLDDVREDVITLKVKSGIWGAVAGFMGAVLMKIFLK